MNFHEKSQNTFALICWRLLHIAAFAIASLGGVYPVIADKIVAKDNFTPNNFNRKTLDRLHGTTIEQGNLDTHWMVTTGANSIVFSTQGTVTTASGNASAEARIGIPTPSSTVTVSARVSASTADWVAVGFLTGASGDGSSWLAQGKAGARIWLLFRPSGAWTLFSDGTARQLLAGGPAAYPSILYKAETPCEIGVSYDPVIRKARPFIRDGTTEVNLFPRDNGWIDTRLPDDTTIGAAGFRINGRSGCIAGKAWVDDFLVTEAAIGVTRFPQLPEQIRKRVPLGTPRKSADIEASPFGIHTTILHEGGGLSPQFIDRIAGLVSEGGYKWVVDYIGSGHTDGMTVEEVEQKFTRLPERCFRYAGLLRDAGVNLLVRIDPMPWVPRGQEATYDYTPESETMRKALAFVRLTVRQLKPYVSHWQIWNEPNLGNATPFISPENYVKVFAQVARVIREEQPGATLYGPGTAMLQCLATTPYPWIPKVLEAGLLDHVDVFTFHPYRQPAVRENLPEHASEFHPWETWKSYENQIADLRNLLGKHAKAGTSIPLAATEDGMPDLINGAGEQPISWIVGAKYELRRALIDTWLGVNPRTLFCLYRPIPDIFYHEQSSYSIVTADFQKKPVFNAAQNLNAVLDSSYTRTDAVPVTITPSGKGSAVPKGKLQVQTYRKDHGGFEELLVFYWSAEISADTHARYPATLAIDQPGWQAPLLIDLMSMPVRRPKTAPVEIIDSKFVDRRDPEVLPARFTDKGVLIDHINIRDYPILIKWVRIK